MLLPSAEFSPFQMRVYYIQNINYPIAMIPRGVKNYFDTHFRGHAMEGSVRRAELHETGDEVIVLSIVASHATLSEVENSLLNSDAWDWETRHREDQRSFSHRRFTILPVPSEIGAVKD